MGAKIIEKHFKLNDIVNSPDKAFSLNKKQFTKMVNKIRDAEKAIGGTGFELTKRQVEARKYCRSLYVVREIKRRFNHRKNIKSVRPGYGLEPKYYNKVLGMAAKKNLCVGDRLTFDVLV